MPSTTARSPHGKVLTAALADGRWHYRGEVAEKVRAAVPPGLAARTWFGKRRRDSANAVALPTDVQRGRHHVATHLIDERIRYGSIERRYWRGHEQLRVTPVAAK